MAFYDYEMVVSRLGVVTYFLRADGKPLPVGRCKVAAALDGTALRTTEWASKNGRREQWFPTIDEALTSGIAWARRRARSKP